MSTSLLSQPQKNVDWVWINTARTASTWANSIMALAGVESKRVCHNESFFGCGTGLEIEDPNYIYLSNVTANKNGWAPVAPTLLDVLARISEVSELYLRQQVTFTSFTHTK